MSSHSAGWMARVYSSDRSCLILHTSTQHSVRIRLNRLLMSERIPLGTGMLTEAAGGGPASTDIADASLPGVVVVVQRAAGVVAEHLVQGHVVTQRFLELVRRAGGADVAGVHQRGAVAVDVGLVHV